MLALTLLLAISLQAPAEPLVGFFPLDPVRLLRDGVEEDGELELATVHALWEYRFVSETTRAEFLAHPAKYEIQLGGACGRMGALSGTGNPHLHAVHDGRLYLFASEACRTTFLRDPSQVLEPDGDPEFASTDEERARGAALLAKCVDWLGGAAALDRAVLRWSKDEIIASGDREDRSHESMLLAPDGSTRQEYAWNAFFSTDVLNPRDAFRHEAEGVRTLAAAQRRALERRRYRDLIGLLQARQRDGFLAASPAAGVLRIRCDGTTHELEVDPASGMIRAHAFTGWGGKLRYGALRRNFTRWTEAGGLRVPCAWEETFAGAAQDPTDRLAAGWKLEVLDAVPPQAFARPQPAAAAD